MVFSFHCDNIVFCTYLKIFNYQHDSIFDLIYSDISEWVNKFTAEIMPYLKDYKQVNCECATKDNTKKIKI